MRRLLPCTIRSSSLQVTGWWSGAAVAAGWDTSISGAQALESGESTPGRMGLLA